MNVPDVFAQVRPLFRLGGSIAILFGLVDLLGITPLPGQAIYTMAAGYFVKHI